MAETKIAGNQTSGLMTIVGEGAPNIQTPAVEIGQHYLDSLTGEEYYCTSLTDGGNTENYTIVGNDVSVSNDYIASGFSANSYVDTGYVIDTTVPWEIRYQAKYNANANLYYKWYCILGGLTEHDGFIFTNNSASTTYVRFRIELSYNGSTWGLQNNGGITVQTGVDYFFKIGWTGAKYYVDISTDEVNYTRDIEVNSTTPMYSTNNVFLGCMPYANGNAFPGTMDLKKVVAYENGQIAYQAVLLGNGPTWAKVGQDLTKASGYSSSGTQVLKNINGVLTWVTEE